MGFTGATGVSQNGKFRIKVPGSSFILESLDENGKFKENKKGQLDRTPDCGSKVGVSNDCSGFVVMGGEGCSATDFSLGFFNNDGKTIKIFKRNEILTEKEQKDVPRTKT